MPFPFVSPAISNTLVKVRWREQYGSAGFNTKLGGITPAGIYRGFVLGTSGSNNSITVIPDTVHQDHLAVYETSTGYSLTVRDMSNTTYTLALTDASLYSQPLVIAILVSYTTGSDTTAKFIAYTQAEFLALSASARGELVVLGTVVNPASGNPVTTILPTYQTLASLDPSLLIWKQLLSNGGFERSPDARTITNLEVEGWVASGNWQTNSTDTDTGTRCVQFNVPSAGTYTEYLRQYIGTSTVVGQLLLIKLSKKVVTAATGGSGVVTVGYTQEDGGTATEITQSFVINSTDASYQDLSFTFVTPSACEVIQYVGVHMVAAVYAASGAKVRIDNVVAMLEPKTAFDQLTFADERFRLLFTNALVINDGVSTSYADPGVALSYTQGSPTGEGRAKLQRKDGDYTGGNLPPALALDGRIYNLGAQLLATAATALLPRLSAQFSGGETHTLLFESTNSITGGVPAYRVYLSAGNRTLFITNNASFDGTNWNKDEAGTAAGQVLFGAGTTTFNYQIAGTDTWIDSAWLTSAQSNADGSFTFDSAVNVDGSLTMAVNENIIQQGTGYTQRAKLREITVPACAALADPLGTVTQTAGTPGMAIGIGQVTYYPLHAIAQEERFIKVFVNCTSTEASDVTFTLSSGGFSGTSMVYADIGSPVTTPHNVGVFITPTSPAAGAGFSYYVKIDNSGSAHAFGILNFFVCVDVP